MLKNSYQIVTTLFFSFFLSIFCQQARAEDIALDAMLREAAFVFEGTVQKVTYRHSEPVGGSTDAGLPYTFVTYSVEKIIKGSYSGTELTLRFLGGPTGHGDEILMLPNYPLFDPGEHDILFVTGNTHFECPLVGCSRGRFRFINGLIVNENGQTLMFNADGSLQVRSPIEHDDLRNHNMGEKFTIQKERDSEPLADEQPGRGYDRDLGDDSYLDDTAGAEHAEESDMNDDLVQAEDFGGVLSSRVQSLGLPDGDHLQNSVETAEIDKPFLSPANRAEEPPQSESKEDASPEDIGNSVTVALAPGGQPPVPPITKPAPIAGEPKTIYRENSPQLQAADKQSFWMKSLGLFALAILSIAILFRFIKKN